MATPVFDGASEAEIKVVETGWIYLKVDKPLYLMGEQVKPLIDLSPLVICIC